MMCQKRRLKKLNVFSYIDVAIRTQNCIGCAKSLLMNLILGKWTCNLSGIITEVENKINQLCVKNFNEMDTVIEDTVTAKAQSGDIDEMASLFNSVSFRDFVMTGYKQKCAITGNVIQYKSFMNLEAAHIWPRSHKVYICQAMELHCAEICIGHLIKECLLLMMTLK